MSHDIHWSPAVRELVAREVAAAEQRGAERVAQAVERLADEMHARGCHYRHQQGETDECNSCTAHRFEALVAEHRDERPTPEHHRIGSRCTLDNCPEEHDPMPKWVDLFGAVPGINLCGEPDDVTADELVAVMTTYTNRAGNARRILAAFHVTPRAAR